MTKSQDASSETDEFLAENDKLKKRAAELESSYEAALSLVGAIDNLQEALALYDSQDRLILYNKQFLKINPRAEEFVREKKTYEDGIRMNVKKGLVEEAIGREEEFIRQRVKDHQNPDGTLTVRDYTDGRRFILKEAKTADGGIILSFSEITELRKVEERLVAAQRRAEELSRTDELTGLNNRRAFFDLAKGFEDQARRYKHDLSFLMLDIDHFKTINDTYGHPVGDEVLRRVSETFMRVIRQSDVAGRIGGEEFAILLPETALVNARELAERLLAAISEIVVATDNGDVSVTVSLGLVDRKDSNATVEELMSRADRALYRAKELGRNRICEFSDDWLPI